MTPPVLLKEGEATYNLIDGMVEIDGEIIVFAP